VCGGGGGFTVFSQTYYIQLLPTTTCCDISVSSQTEGNQFPEFPRAVRDQRPDTIEICMCISLIFKQREHKKPCLNHPSLFVAES
jgi:hypothetical protein